MIADNATYSGQYGDGKSPLVYGNGGAAMFSNLGTAAMGMLTAGGSEAIKAAVQSAGDSSTTTQTPTSNIGPQSTGSKVFQLAPSGDAMTNNDFWKNAIGGNSGGSSMFTILWIAAAVAVLFFIFRKR